MTSEGTPLNWQASTPAVTAHYDSYHRSVLPELNALTGRQQALPQCGAGVGARVAQLDAGRLDQELTGMLQEQMTKALKYFRPGVMASLQPEVTLLLNLLIYAGSVWLGRPTPGSALMSLRYRNESSTCHSSSANSSGGIAAAAMPQLATPTGDSPMDGSSTPLKPSCHLVAGRTGVEGPGLTQGQRCAFGVLIVARYAWARTAAALTTRHWTDSQAEGAWTAHVWRLMQRTEAAVSLASLLNTLLFLKQGIYRSVSDRVVGARLVLQRASMARALSFEYLNRQLVWTELSELLLFLLPLLNVTQLRSRVVGYLPLAVRGRPTSPITGSGESKVTQQACTICSTSPILRPYAAQPCGHLSCYYCLRACTQADAGYKCSQCSTKVIALQLANPLTPAAAAPLRTL